MFMTHDVEISQPHEKNTDSDIIISSSRQNEDNSMAVHGEDYCMKSSIRF